MGVEEVKKRLLSNNNNKPPGSDNFDRTLLRIIADYIATPIFFYLFNLSLQESVCPQASREAKVILLPKNSKAPFLLAQTSNQPVTNPW